jgi:putative tryptophan/tyrosine transport system substrate-binding protein
MRRREFVRLLGGAAAAGPLAARAQQSTSTVRRLGALMQPTAEAAKARGFLDAFTQALNEAGWVEGRNIVFEHRFAAGEVDGLGKLAAELVASPVDIIVTDATPSARAAKSATRTIPIVMVASSDAVANGLVVSFSRPGGNVTGLSILTTDLTGRRPQLLTEMVPGLKRAAALTNPSDPGQASQLKQAQTAAQSLGLELHVAEVPGPDKLDSAFATISEAGAPAPIVLQAALFFNQHPRIVAFTMASRLPAIFAGNRSPRLEASWPTAPSIPALFRRAAVYVDKIFRGASPAELPVELSSTFEFVINLRTAKALGLTVPDKLLATADEVIE